MAIDQTRKRRRLNSGNGTASLPATDQHPALEEQTGSVLDDDEDLEAPSDTMAALELLRRQFPVSAQVPPVILRSQVYNILSDWTAVDRALEEERQKGVLRMIKLPASVDDYAYLLKDDYDACIDNAAQEQREKGVAEARLAVFAKFSQGVLPRCKETSLSHADLGKHLSRDPGGTQGEGRAKMMDQQISLLMTTGLLTRNVAARDSYLFAVPGAGRLVTSIAKGRKEAVAALSRKKYKEAFLKDVMKWKLRGSCLDMQWHLRDLLGRGIFKQVATTSGPLLRVVKPGA